MLLRISLLLRKDQVCKEGTSGGTPIERALVIGLGEAGSAPRLNCGILIEWAFELEEYMGVCC